MRETIYIAGKISGLPYWRTYFKFLLREIMLWICGYYPINPMRVIPKDWEYRQQVAYGCHLAICADCIYLAHNWRKSKGAYRKFRAFLRAGKGNILTFYRAKSINTENYMLNEYC